MLQSAVVNGANDVRVCIETCHVVNYSIHCLLRLTDGDVANLVGYVSDLAGLSQSCKYYSI